MLLYYKGKKNWFVSIKLLSLFETFSDCYKKGFLNKEDVPSWIVLGSSQEKQRASLFLLFISSSIFYFEEYF